jgi:hypothetical protein
MNILEGLPAGDVHIKGSRQWRIKFFLSVQCSTDAGVKSKVNKNLPQEGKMFMDCGSVIAHYSQCQRWNQK